MNELERANSDADDSMRSLPFGMTEAAHTTTDRVAFINSLVCICANIVLITALLPYISPFPLVNLDVQPLAFVVSSVAVLGLFAFAPRLLCVNTTDLGILFIGLICLIYVRPSAVTEDWVAAIRGCAPIVLGFPVYLAVRGFYRFMSPRVFLLVVYFYCAVLVCQLIFPSAYALIFPHLLSDTRFFSAEGRGPNGLCTEPSMMGNMCLLFIVSLYVFHKDYWAKHRILALSIVVISVAMLIVTESGTGVVLGFLVALASLLSSRLSIKAKIAFLSGFLVLALSLGLLLSESAARGAKVLVFIVSNPSSFLQEESVAERCLTTFTGLYQIPEAPFGSGKLGVDLDLTYRALSSGPASFIWPEPGLRALLFDIRTVRDTNTGVGSMIERMGIVGVLLVFALLHPIRGFRGKWVVRVFVVGLFFNASLFIPTLWFLVGSCVTSRDSEEPSRSSFIHFLRLRIEREAESCL